MPLGGKNKLAYPIIIFSYMYPWNIQADRVNIWVLVDKISLEIMVGKLLYAAHICYWFNSYLGVICMVLWLAKLPEGKDVNFTLKDGQVVLFSFYIDN